MKQAAVEPKKDESNTAVPKSLPKAARRIALVMLLVPMPNMAETYILF